MSPTTDAERRTVPLIHAGARRGAQALAPYLATWSRAAAFDVVPTYVDPVPGRATAMSLQVRELGLAARARETSIEEFLGLGPSLEPKAIVVLTLDHPRGIARALARSRDVPVLAYNVWQFPTGHLAGFVAAISPEDHATRDDMVAFFTALADITARAGSNAVFGPDAQRTNGVVEPVYRETFARHFERNFPKLAAGLEPEDAPIGLTFDGRKTEPAVVVQSPESWRTGRELESTLPQLTRTPLGAGQSLLIMQLGPDGLRVHRAGFRRIDGTPQVQTITGVDPHVLAAMRTVREIDSVGLALPASMMAGALLFTD